MSRGVAEKTVTDCWGGSIFRSERPHAELIRKEEKGGGGGGGGGGPTLFIKNLLGASAPTPLQPNTINALPMLNREQHRGYQKSDPGEDRYYIGCLDQTRVALPE